MKALAFALFLMSASLAEGPVVITTSPNDTEPKVVLLDDIRITVTREGEIRRVRVERLGLPTDYKLNEYVIEPVDGQLRATAIRMTADPLIPTRKLVIDGVNLGDSLALPPQRRYGGTWRYYVCPSDETMLRVPRAGEYACPLDGTQMKPVAGTRNPYFLLN